MLSISSTSGPTQCLQPSPCCHLGLSQCYLFLQPPAPHNAFSPLRAVTWACPIVIYFFNLRPHTMPSALSVLSPGLVPILSISSTSGPTQCLQPSPCCHLGLFQYYLFLQPPAPHNAFSPLRAVTGACPNVIYFFNLRPHTMPSALSVLSPGLVPKLHDVVLRDRTSRLRTSYTLSEQWFLRQLLVKVNCDVISCASGRRYHQTPTRTVTRAMTWASTRDTTLSTPPSSEVGALKR